MTIPVLTFDCLFAFGSAVTGARSGGSGTEFKRIAAVMATTQTSEW